MPDVNEKLFTPQELADKLGVKLSTIYYWSHIGYIPTVKLGKLIRFRKKAIEDWILKKENDRRAIAVVRTTNFRLKDTANVVFIGQSNLHLWFISSFFCQFNPNRSQQAGWFQGDLIDVPAPVVMFQINIG